MTLPPIPHIDAIIIGAQKAGTSSLAYALALHPMICKHHRPELPYFIDEQEYARGWEAAYRRYFPSCDPNALLLAKSVAIMSDPTFLARVREHNPDVRIIAMLRNPVDRAYSAYLYARRKGFETMRTFEEALDADPSRHGNDDVRRRNTSYRAMGEYRRQLDDVMARFRRDQTLLLLYEDFTRDAQATYARVFAFLGIDSAFVPHVGGRRNASAMPRSSTVAQLLSSQHPVKRWLRRRLPDRLALGWRRSLEGLNRVASSTTPMAAATRARLAAHYAPHNARLRELLEHGLPGWD